MDPHVQALYHRLGYRGVVAGPPPGAAGMMAFGAPPGTDAAAAAPPPLDLAGIAELERQLDNAPEATLAVIRRTYRRDITEPEVRLLLAQARGALLRPAAAVAAFDAAIPIGLGNTTLPDDFGFEGYDRVNLPAKPADIRFETVRDALGWVFHCGWSWARGHAGLGRKADFRWAEDHPSGFVYDVSLPASGTLSVALFSDFGTGIYTSRYIARNIARRRPEVAVHLGDVYYAGTTEEFADAFIPILKPLLDHTELFVMLANHEMFAGGFTYFDYVDAKRAANPRQRQEGSYFALRTPGFLIVAIDCEYHRDGRVSEPRLRAWLRAQLEAARAAGATTILLTSDEPYTLGSAEPAPLLAKDLAGVVRDQLVDLWFWGNTHYAALFDSSDAVPVVGSCIGHGGYPYLRNEIGNSKVSVAPAVFVEDAPRFPAATGVRQDAGNNGFVMLALRADGSVELEYVDWMNRSRHRTVVARDPARGRAVVRT